MPGLRSLLSLWPYLRPHRRRLVLGLLCVIVASAMPPLMIKILGTAIDGFDRHAPVRFALERAGLMVAVTLLGGVFRYAMRELMNGVSRYVEYDLRNALFRHLEGLDAIYFGRTRTGDIMARLTNDLSAVRMAAGPAMMYLTETVTGGVFALAFMLHVSPRLTGLAVLPMVLLPAIMVRLGRLIHSRFEAVQEHFGTLTTRAQENLSGTRIVRAYRQEGAELARFGALNEGYLAKNMSLARLYGGMMPAFTMLGGFSAAIVLGVGGALTLRGVISVAEFVTFGLYLGYLTRPLMALGFVINLFERGAASMTRLNEIFASRSMITETPVPRVLPPLASGVRGRSIEFRHVGFHYPVRPGQAARWVLRDVSFTLPAGATLGVVGATGSGKTALIDLIPRIFDAQEGEILIDGIPIRELPVDRLRREIGAVPQESLLFSDTIGSNLAYGRDARASRLASDNASSTPSGTLSGTASGNGDAAPSTIPTVTPVHASELPPPPDDTAEIDADTQWAAQVAQLEETIADFPGGFGTMLGERGINLSGGQKQRAALARALARRPAIVLLDDALSAVDTHTEAEILRALRDAVTGRTAVIASHRVSAIRDATWIVVLDDGRIVEQGRHEELLALGGRYWSLLRRQQLVDAIEDEAA